MCFAEGGGFLSETDTVDTCKLLITVKNINCVSLVTSCLLLSVCCVLGLLGHGFHSTYFTPVMLGHCVSHASFQGMDQRKSMAIALRDWAITALWSIWTESDLRPGELGVGGQD